MLPKDIQSKLVEVLTSNPCLKGAILFGSAGKGELRSDSDIDIAVFVDGSLPAQELLQIKAASAQVTEREVDIVPMSSHLSYVLQNEIARDGVVLFSRDPDLMERFFLKAPQQYADFMTIRRPLEEEYIRRKMQ